MVQPPKICAPQKKTNLNLKSRSVLHAYNVKDRLTILDTVYLQVATIRTISRSLHRVETKFDQLAGILQQLTSTSHRTSQPSATDNAIGCSDFMPHVAERNKSKSPRPAEHNENGPTVSRPWSIPPVTNPIPHIYHPSTNETLAGRHLQQVSPNLSSTTITIELGDKELTFDPRTVPDPPTVTFADDIDRLVEEWSHSSRLTIAGEGIAIRYWDKVYTKRAGIKEFAWDSLRSSWGNWKVSRFLLSKT